MRTMLSRGWRPRRALGLFAAPLIALALSLVPLAPASALAGEIVVNGGFEDVAASSPTTTDPSQLVYTGWTYTGALRTGGYYTSVYDVHSGSHAFMVRYPLNVVIYQDLTTVPGTTYVLGFWHSSVNTTVLVPEVVQGGATTVLGSFGGTGSYGPVDPPYVSHTLTFTATGTLTRLQFRMNDPFGYAGASVAIDDVSVAPQLPATAPGAPTALQATAGHGQVGLTWTAPDNGGAAITGYTVAYKATADAAWSTTAAGSTSATVTGLTNGTEYQFKVLATNSVGDGPYSDVVAATPVAPSVPAAPTGLQAIAGNGQVSLTWTAPDDGGAAITGYTVAYTDTLSWTDSVSVSSTSATITGLNNGLPYRFKVLATNNVGDGPYSEVVTAMPYIPATVPAAPTGLQATPGDGQVSLTWTAPYDGGAAITSYTVAYADTLSWTYSVNVSTTSATITGLNNDLPHRFKVLATNSVGDGPYSEVVTATPYTPARAPEAPTGLQATAGDAQVSLTWTAPYDGGVAITGYTVAFKATTDLSWSTTAAGSTSATVTGLTNGTEYQFKVLATNSVGDGPYSEVVTATPAASGDVLSAIAELRDDVVALDLGKTENRLTVLLDNAAMNIEDGYPADAVPKISSFIDKVHALVAGNRKSAVISPDDVEYLTDQAEQILVLLTS